MKKLILVTLMLFIISISILVCSVITNAQEPYSAKHNDEFDLVGDVKEVSCYYTVTAEERYLLAKLAHAEASVCSEECQRDVVSVVFNRLESGKWRKDVNGDSEITIYDIIYYPNAFTPTTNGAIDKWEPTEKDYRAVDYVIKHGPTVPTEVRYFRMNYDFKWEGYKNYKVIDDTYFGYFENWAQGEW